MKDFKTVIDCITSLLEDSLRFFEDQMTFLENLCQKAFKFIKSFVKKYKALCAISCSITLLAFIFFAPFIFTRSCSWTPDFSASGQIGDTFGIMNPFIAIVAAILTFIAFWTQYQANKKMLEKDEKQEVEHQFYEMLRIHKENVNELKWEQWRVLESSSPNPYKSKSSNKYGYHHILGRQVFEFHATEYMLIEYFLFAAIFKVTQRSRKLHCRISFSKKDLDDLKVVVKTSYSIYLEGMEEKIKSFYSNEKLTNKFFDNLDKAIKQQSPKCSINYSLFEKTIPKCKDYIFKDRNGYIYLYLYIFLKLFKKNTQNYSSDTNKANRLMSGADLFTGHYYELNHYYRHTYQMVKKIANYNNDIISYVEKRNYLKMLRAQLTSDEQTLLFYNWLSGYGSDWENDKNHFFTTYRMIHNINPNVMRIIIFGGKDKVIQMIKDTNPEYNKYENDNLFEFEDKMN